MPLRVVFFGNSESVFSQRHFEALVRTRCRVVAVVDVPPGKRSSTNTRRVNAAKNLIEFARRQSIPTFEPASPNAPEFVAALRSLAPDLFVAVGYMNRLKPEILAVPRLLAANFHASLLPAYRGKHPLFWALRNGERWAGLTVHVMDPDLDTGDLLYQVRVRTRRRDTVASLYDRIMDVSLPLVRRLIADAESGTLVRTPQSSVGASYYSSTQEKDFRLDWTCAAEPLRRWIHISPGQCFSDLAGHRIFFSGAECVTNAEQYGPGVLAKIGRTRVTIAAGKDALRVRRARLDQEPEQAAAQLFRALRLEVGTNLREMGRDPMSN
jgi:methionyl-tRNA formyltransferase